MLQGLDAVAWPRREGEDAAGARARGAEIEAALRAVASGDARAMSRLEELIDPRGVASVEAFECVPFLWEISEVASGALKAKALVLLGDLACGGDHERFLGSGGAFEALDVDDGSFARDLRARVALDAPRAEPMLEDKSAEVRAAAAFVLATSGRHEAVWSLARAIVHEKNERALADELVALGWLSVASPTSQARALLDERRARGEGHVRIAASIGAAHAGVFDRETRVALSDATSAAEDRSIWAGGRWREHAIAVALAKSLSTEDELTAVALEMPEDARADLLAGAMRVAFRAELRGIEGDASVEPPAPWSSPLDVRQRAVLRAIERSEATSGDVLAFLDALGLPMSPPSIRAILGDDEPPSPLDELIAFGDRFVSVREAWLEAASKSQGAFKLPNALASSFGADACVDVALLAVRLDAPSQARSHALFLLLADRLGAEAVAPLERAFHALLRDGVPWVWSERGARVRCAHLVPLVGIALYWLAPDDERVRELLTTSKMPEGVEPFPFEAFCARFLVSSAEVSERATTIVAEHLARWT